MFRKSALIIIIFFALILSACNLPKRQAGGNPSSNPPAASNPQFSPTPVSVCDNTYFPSAIGTSWAYSGSDSATGSYSRNDTVSRSDANSFTVDTTAANVSYAVNYSCTTAGLTASDPVTQYAGALLSGPNSPVTVKLTSNTGITLPADVKPGDTWQQTADFEATSPNINISGRFVFNYQAMGFEEVSVPAGSYNALRVDATIDIELSAFHVSAGTYTTSIWVAPEVGIVKSQGASHVTGLDFSDSLQLTGFTPAQ